MSPANVPRRNDADVSPLELNLSGRRVGEAGDQSGDRRFPRAALPDDPEAFALGEIEVDIVDGMQHRPAPDREPLAKAGDLEKPAHSGRQQ